MQKKKKKAKGQFNSSAQFRPHIILKQKNTQKNKTP